MHRAPCAGLAVCGLALAQASMPERYPAHAAERALGGPSGPMAVGSGSTSCGAGDVMTQVATLVPAAVGPVLWVGTGSLIS